MKKYFIIFASLIISATLVANADTVTRTDRTLYANTGTQIPQSNIKKLGEMENVYYGQAYIDQELIDRIERLENTVYNRYYSNYPIDRRLTNLIYNYNRRNQLARTGKIRRMVNGINSAFTGVPTGFTPPISDPYYNGYGNYNSYYGSNGWRYNSGGIGTGSGVRILD